MSNRFPHWTIDQLKAIRDVMILGPTRNKKKGWDKEDALFIETWLMPYLDEVISYAEGTGTYDRESNEVRPTISSGAVRRRNSKF